MKKQSPGERIMATHDAIRAKNALDTAQRNRRQNPTAGNQAKAISAENNFREAQSNLQK